MAPELVHGTAPAGGATKQLIDMILMMDPTFPVTEIRGTARRFVSEVVPAGQELTSGKISGGLGFNSFVYPLSMIFGTAVITQPAGFVNARKWVWTVPLSGSINPVSMDIEQGDANDAEQFLYCICDSIGIDATRSAVAPSGTVLARAVNKQTPNGTFAGMTGSGLSVVPLAPVLPDDWAVYMDLTSGNLGQTKLTRAFHAKLDYGSAFLPFYALDNAQSSYAGVADGDQVKATMLIEMMKDPAVGESLWPSARQGFRRYLRLLAGGVGVSPLIDNYQTLIATGAVSGTFNLVFGGVTSPNINWNDSAATILPKLTGMSSVGAGNVTVTGGPLPGTQVVITFTGTLAQTTNVFTVTGSTLSGGAATLASIQIPYSMQYDMAGEVSAPGANKDTTGLRTRDWTFTIVEDPVWGNALIVTVVNALLSL